MKKSTTLISLVIITIMGCLNEVNNTDTFNYNSLSIEELANEVVKDSVFLYMHNQTKSQFKRITNTMNEIKSENLMNLSQEEILNRLGLNESYWEKRRVDNVKQAEYLNDKFKLSERSEDEIKNFFKLLYEKSKLQKSFGINSNCQAQFEDDIAEAHASYDFSIIVVCPIIAITTGSGGVGYLACSAGAVLNATIAVANAIDDYNACMS